MWSPFLARGLGYVVAQLSIFPWVPLNGLAGRRGFRCRVSGVRKKTQKLKPEHLSLKPETPRYGLPAFRFISSELFNLILLFFKSADV
jgi:hypothetical protein